MKINTFKDSTIFEDYVAIMKAAGVSKEVMETAVRQIDEIAEIATPALKNSLDGLREAIELAGRDSDDAMAFLTEALQEITRVQKQVADGSVMRELASTQEALGKMTRSRTDLLNKWRALKKRQPKIIEKLRSEYDKSLEHALKQTGAAEAQVKSLRDEFASVAQKHNEAIGALKSKADEVASLESKLMKAQKDLAGVTDELAQSKGVIETLTAKNKELIEKYEKLLAQSQKAEEALAAAKKAGAPTEAVEGLEAAAKSRKQAADQLATAVTKGDASAKEALERETKAKLKSKKSPKRTTPDTPAAKTDKLKSLRDEVNELKLRKKKEELSGAGFWKGWNTGKEMAGKAAGAALLSGLGKIAIWGLLAYGAYRGYNYIYGWVYGDPEAAKRNAESFDAMLRDAHAKLQKVQFKSDSTGAQIKVSYSRVMESCFGVLPNMVENSQNNDYIKEAGKLIQELFNQTDSFLDLKDIYAEDLATEVGWSNAITAIQKLKQFGDQITDDLAKLTEDASQQAFTPEEEQSKGPRKQQRPEPDPDDKGINVLNKKVYLSQYPELDPATRSAAPVLIKRVLLSPTGLSFWDPQGQWGGGFLRNTGDIGDQVLRHVKFFLNPRAIDRDWAYGPINNERKLKKFMRKNMPKAGRKPGSGYKKTRRQYRRNRPRLAFSSNTDIKSMDSAMKNRKNRTDFLEKLATSINSDNISLKSIDKFADATSKSYYQDALRGLGDQYAKSYYTGLKSMYDQKLGGDKADYRKLYEPNGGDGTEILQESYPDSVVVADAMGNGGLVENSLEQQRHNVGVALSAPTGNFRGKHANLVAELVKIANQFETNEASELVDAAIDDIVKMLKS